MNTEEKLFMRWVVSYQTTMEYEQFKRELHLDQNYEDNNETEEEILKSVRQILEVANGTEHI